MIRVGIAGLGFMGMVHYQTYQKIPGVEVVAIADRHPERLAGDWTGIKGNFGPPGGQTNLTGVATYATPSDLVADPNVDLVDICLPPAAHKDVAIHALSSGKHVFCEKPLALSIGDCDQMIAAASESDRRLLVGHVLPYFPEYAWALREIRNGAHGRVLGASFNRVISDPAWLDNYWRSDLVGGPLLDLHVHDAHFVCLVLGVPASVVARGSTRSDLPEYWQALLQYRGDAPVVRVTCGVVNQPGRPFLHGFEIRMERATMAFEFTVEVLDDGEYAAYSLPPTIYRSDGKVSRVDLGDGDPMRAFEAELRQVTEVLGSNVEAGPLDAKHARNAVALCQMQADSLLGNA